MDWIESKNQLPPNKSTVWVRDCFGEAHLAVIRLVKGRNYFHGRLKDGTNIMRCTKWATYDVAY